jgi:glycosyltransferase involved in cell wall biosynthesis
VKIELNATRLNSRPSGARQRFIGIYSELFALLPADEFVVYEPADCRVGDWFPQLANVSYVKTSIRSDSRVRKFMGDFEFLRARRKAGVSDVFEWFNFPAFKSPSKRSLITVHDIRSIFTNTNILSRNIQKRIVSASLNAVDGVVAVSETTRREVLSLCPRSSVCVIYNGVDPVIYNSVDLAKIDAVRNKLGLPSEFILAVGHLERRKNYVNLIEALTILHGRDCAVPLVIVGNDSGERASIVEAIERRGLSGYVILMSGLSDLEVRCLYILCTLFVFPSAYEGFGIPILEAMAAKRPMVLSDISVFREITEDRGVYFSPECPESIAAAIYNGLTSPTLRQKLVDYGEKRIHDFSFKNIARAYAKLYREIG